MLNGEAGYGASYGSKDFPFFKNFYIGGVNSVRGFETSAIGPRLPNQTTGTTFATGGTKRLLGNAEIYFPIPGMKDAKQLRLSTFIDTGSVYAADQDISLSDLRFSTGLGISWYSPFGPIKLVLAKALNPKKNADGSVDDRTQLLQFQLGSQF